MSDYEDEMDVDSTALKESVIFNSDNINSKGKRSAADLPVVAEDSLPWCAGLLRVFTRPPLIIPG